MLIDEEDLKRCQCMGEINTLLVHDGYITYGIHEQHETGEQM